ncbi:MAG: hypothetical protein JST40_08365 [Armatimonadetes bacterium]|nr:hypothetical protein [Armatimonadota bacterium]
MKRRPIGTISRSFFVAMAAGFAVCGFRLFQMQIAHPIYPSGYVAKASSSSNPSFIRRATRKLRVLAKGILEEVR